MMSTSTAFEDEEQLHKNEIFREEKEQKESALLDETLKRNFGRKLQTEFTLQEQASIWNILPVSDFKTLTEQVNKELRTEEEEEETNVS